MKKYIQEVKSLRRRSGRRETGLVIVEGYLEIKRALAAGAKIQKFFVCKDVVEEDILDEFSDHSLIHVSKDIFKEMAFGPRLKGLIAFCSIPEFDLTSLSIDDQSTFLVLEAIHKPGNLGTILRTCDGAGVTAVFISDPQMEVYNQHVVRSSVGGVFNVPTFVLPEQDIVDFFRQKNIKIFGTSALTEKLYTDVDFKKSCAFVMGNEHDGLSDFWKKECDELIKIPMKGVVSSLNLAMSASIFIYEAVRQKREL